MLSGKINVIYAIIKSITTAKGVEK